MIDVPVQYPTGRRIDHHHGTRLWEKGNGTDMEIRIGTILVQQGVLTTDQVKAVLSVQQRTGQPFGLICEEIYAVDPSKIESAWAQQYAQVTRSVDPRLVTPEPAALSMATRRQAWQFNTLPIAWDGPELMLATTPEALTRALRFATNVLGVPAYFVMCEPEALQCALQEHYTLPGATLYGRRSRPRAKAA